MFQSLELKNLNFETWDTNLKLLKDISLRISTGERIGITGASGSGKTTLCYHLAGVHRDALTGKTSGEILVNGHPIHFEDTSDSGYLKAGMILQNPESQLFASTVADEIGYGLTNPGDEEIQKTLRILGLEDLGGHEIHTLSLGQKQRVVIAAFLTIHPDLLILDEPTNSLDSATSDRFLEYLSSIDCTQIMIEHDLERLARWADRIIEMADGRIVIDAPAELWLEKTQIKPRGFQIALSISEKYGFSCPPKDIGRLPDWASQTEGALFEPEIRIENPPFSELLLRFEQVDCGYKQGNQILQDVTFSIHSGEVVALLGLNGSGKTTLLKHMAGLLKPQAGCILWKDEALPYGKPELLFGRVGLVFQNPDYQIFDSTVERECEFCLRNHRIPQNESAHRVDKWLKRFDLDDLKDRSPLTLSYGEKRRLTLASILVAEPKLLLLDEPTTALDESFIKYLRNLIHDLVKNHSLSICIATHDADFALDVADRIVLLSHGRVQADVPVSQLTVEHLEQIGLPVPLTSQIAIQSGIIHQPVGYWNLKNQLKEYENEKTA